MDTVIGWITENLKPEYGHSQQITTDDYMHVQGESLRDIYDRMAEDFGPTSRRAASHNCGTLPSYDYFCKAVREMNKIAKNEDGILKATREEAQLSAMKKDPWSTQGECGQCSGLKVLRRKAIASGALFCCIL